MQAFKVVQIISYHDHVLALDDVGGIWRGREVNFAHWEWIKIAGPLL